MSKKNYFPVGVALVILGLVFPLANSGGEELSPSLLGYLRVENPDRMIAGLERFLQGLDIPPLAGAALKMGLGGVIENPNLAGVDLSAPVILASFPPDRSEAWAVSLALPAPEAYHRALVKNWKFKSPEKMEGIRIYTREIKEFDSQAFSAATPEERIDVDSFYRPEEKTLAVAAAKKRVWISPALEILKEVAPLFPADFPSPVSGDLVIGLQVRHLLEIAEESMRAGISSPPAGAPAAAVPFGPPAARAMLEAYLDFYLHYARQVENLFFGLTLDGSGVRVEELLRAGPETGLAKFLAAQKKGKLCLARFLEPSPWLAADGRIDDPEMLLEIYSRFFAIVDEIMAQTGEAGDEQEAVGRLAAVWKSYISLLDDYLKRCVGDEMAFSISSSPENFISGVSIQKIRDREAYRDYIQKSFLSNREILTPFYAELGIAVDDSGIEKPEIFQGIEIYTARMTFDFKKLFPQKAIPEDQKKILALMESPFVIQFAASGDLAVAEMSWGGEPDIKSRLERIASGKSSFDTDRLGASWAEANGVIYFSLDRYLNNFLGPMIERAEIEEGKASTADDLRALGQLDLPLVAYLTVDGPNLKATVDIPMERILAVKAVIDDIQAKKEQAAETGGR
jgi:hypothetical protein